MDEQTTQPQQPLSYDVSADGAAYQYEDDPPSSATEQQVTTDPEPDPKQERQTSDFLPADAIRLKDGKLEFGKDFFGEQPEEQKSPPQTNQKTDEIPKTDQKTEEIPKYYTEDELKNIPYEQWELSRLNGDIQKFAPIVHEQIQRRNAQARAQTMQNVPFPSEIVEPKAYTPKELSDEAMKLACEKLGIEDTEDFDAYDLTHLAAIKLAMDELTMKRNAELSDYRQAANEWQEHLRYQSELPKREDFSEFNEWYMNELKKIGITHQQMEAAILQKVKENGNHYGIVPRIIESWYQAFRQQKNAQPKYPKYPIYPAATGNYPQSKAGTRRPNPPILESTQGNNYAGNRQIRAEAFSEMDEDEQAQALIKLGLV